MALLPRTASLALLSAQRAAAIPPALPYSTAAASPSSPAPYLLAPPPAASTPTGLPKAEQCYGKKEISASIDRESDIQVITITWMAKRGRRKTVSNKEEVAEDYCFACKDGVALRICDFK